MSGATTYVSTTTPLVKYTDLPTATLLNPADILCIVQAGQSKQITFAAFQALSRIQAIPISAGHAVQVGEMGFLVDGSGGSVVVTLPDLASWPGIEMLFFNVGASGQFTIQASGSDVIMSQATGQPTSSIQSGLPGSNFGLRKIIVSPPALSGWYTTRT